ncbi:ComEA family DNA-binding protein [Tsukamurella ocularis]|uniref:ComEA family DNA-binding protein n=1 Tax=Tsukamurella ocularis TaxID=1970234 RepID=UPI0021695B53|nr:ComEA family DNA-binding protein [Tsukamurella ocularis]MCS3781997.1 competence protein ComEA [Tsukamurella ocularis]MCS3788491.1 competence protein ComEA [Tsukamurella ocularis]MCS3852211.1 competence protein ComEA [Tsukamurella ocularis]
MNGERGAAAGSGVADEQIFARPAWLEEFAPDRRDGGRPDVESDGALAPSRRVRMEDDDFWDEQEPTGWRSTVEKVRTTPRAAVALVVVGVIAAVVAAVVVLGPSREGGGAPYPVVDFAGASTSVEPSAAAGAPSAPAASGAATASSPALSELVVAVVGLVRAPGLHRLRPGARVADALTAARGALGGADTASLNLAQPLLDGDQVVVGVVDQKAGVTLRSSVRSGPAVAAVPAGTPGGAASGTGTAAAGTVNINTANATELDRLPGVGAATAAAIIAYRDKNGPFRTVDDLGKVSGIGDAKLAKIKPMATV